MIIFIIAGILIVCFGFVVARGAPYVPTLPAQLTVAFDEVYRLGADDTVVDLGSGDGAVLRAAAARGAGAIGYELNPILVVVSWWRTRGLTRVKTHCKDYLRLERLPAEVTVVYAFTTGHSIEAIGRKLGEWSHDRDLYFISFGFTLGDRQPLRSAQAVHLYFFPAGNALQS